MAESVETQQEERLKYLDFVQVAAAHALMCLASIYDFAKESSGPLKPGLQSVEGTVRSVIGPVFDRFHGVPLELLKFVDRKMDDTVREVERHVPAMVKEACTAAQKAPEVVRSVAGEVQRSGVVAAAAGMAKEVRARYEPVARELYVRYEPVAEQHAVAAWRAVNRMPVFPQVAHILVPTAAYWAEKYNRTVGYAAEQGYAAATYLPIVPTERIAKVFGNDVDNGEVPVEKEAPVAAVEEEAPVAAAAE